MSTMTRIGVMAAAAILATAAIAQVVQERSPAGPGDRDGRAFRMPADTARPVARQQALRVDSLEVQRVAEGSALGVAGDLLITFKGSGFALTSKSPRLLLPGGTALESTEINREGTELYVLVPRDQMARIGAMRFDSVVVANPGAREDVESARASIRASPARLARPDPGAPAVRLVYRDGAFSREPVRQ